MDLGTVKTTLGLFRWLKRFWTRYSKLEARVTALEQAGTISRPGECLSCGERGQMFLASSITMSAEIMLYTWQCRSCDQQFKEKRKAS